MIGATMNSVANANGSNCANYNLPPGETATASLNLAADQTVIAAYLYWSSYLGNQADMQVTFNGTPINADQTYRDSFQAYNFYTCVTDVSTIVQATGSGDYTVGDLDINRSSNCTVSYGGWGMIVVYEDPDLDKNSVNIYEGFRGITTNAGRPPITIPINDLLVANDTGSLLGLLAWEGDRSIGPPAYDELVRFNGNVLSTPMNPGDNLFNGTNSFTGDEELYNMDLDGFDIDDYVDIGDESAEIYIESEQDLVLMNVIAFTLNNELPDATVQFDNLSAPGCDQSQVTIDFSVLNVNSNDVLPANTSIKFYIDDVSTAPLSEEFTTADIPIDGSESLTTTFDIPPGSPETFTIIATVNLDENGEKIFLELNSNNNVTEVEYTAPQNYNVTDEAAICDNETFELIDGTIVEDAGEYTATIPAMNGCDSTVVLTLLVNPLPNAQPAELVECSDNNQATFDLTDAENQFNNGNDYSYTFHETEDDAENDENEIPASYNATGTTSTVYVRTLNEFNCYNVSPIELFIAANPTIGTIANEEVCDNDNDQQVDFDLTTKNSEILNGEDPADFDIYFFENDTDAENGNYANAINDPENYSFSTTPTTIYIRLESLLTGNCFSTSSFTISILDSPPISNAEVTVANCSVGTTGFFNLTDLALEIANGDNSMDVTFYPSVPDAENDNGVITNPGNYESPTATIGAVVTDPTNGCRSVASVELTVIPEPLESNQVLEACATNEDNTTALFDLAQFTDEIIGNVENVTVTYHENETEADNGNNPIGDPANYESVSQIVYARAETSSNGTVCYSLSEIDITVNARPEPNSITYSLCSSSEDQSFDLQSQNELIIANANNYSITYFDSEDNAINNNGAGSIASPYTSSSTTIYARVVETATNCFGVSEIELIVEENPSIIVDTELFTECQQNGSASFSLPDYLSVLETDYPQYGFSFYSTESDAVQQTGAITGTQTSTENVTVFLRVDASSTTCFIVEEITLTVAPIPLLDEGDVIICLNNGYTLPNGEQVFEPGLYERFIIDPDTNCDLQTRTNLILGDVMFPNAFAPNLNNQNEQFRPVPGEECVGEVTDYNLKVFNRWGEIVFETENFSEGWNGMFNNAPAQAGIYIYTCTFTFLGEEREMNGTMKLLR